MNEATQTTLDSGDFHVDLETREITVRGKSIHLTPKEFDLLVYFIKHSGKVVDSSHAAGGLVGRQLRRTERIPARVCRQPAQEDRTRRCEPRYILTEPWIGYRFDPGDRLARITPDQKAQSGILYDLFINPLRPFYARGRKLGA